MSSVGHQKADRRELFVLVPHQACLPSLCYSLSALSRASSSSSSLDMAVSSKSDQQSSDHAQNSHQRKLNTSPEERVFEGSARRKSLTGVQAKLT